MSSFRLYLRTIAAGYYLLRSSSELAYGRQWKRQWEHDISCFYRRRALDRGSRGRVLHVRRGAPLRWSIGIAHSYRLKR